MAGLGDYSKKTKGNRGYKMKGPSLLKMVSALKQKVDPDAPGTPGEPGYEPEVKSMDYLTKTPVGPRAKKIPIDREKLEEEWRVLEGMENVDKMSDEVVHDIVKSKIKEKK